MNCNEVSDNLSLYIDGELSEDDKKLMDEHFKTCSDCSKELEEYKKMIKALRELPKEEPPVGYCKRLKDKLLNAKQAKMPDISEKSEISEIKVHEKLSKVKGSKFRWVKYAGIAAALVLVVLVYGMNRGGAWVPNRNIAYNSSEEARAPQEEAKSEALEEKSKIIPEVRDGSDSNDNNYDNEYFASDVGDKDNSATGYGAVNSGDSKGPTTLMAAEDKEIKIIKTGNIYSSTNDYGKFVDDITSKIESLGGFIENNNTQVYQVYENDKLMHGNLKIRIPKEKFDETVRYIEETSEVRSKNISEADATKEYYEKDNKVKNLEAQEQKLRELFEKAATVEEMLQIENELGRIRTEIDSLNISIEDIDDRVSMSTISLEVEEVREAGFNLKSEEGIWKRSADGFINTVNRIARGAENLVVHFISLSPVLVPVIIIFIILLIKMKKHQKRE